MCTIQEYLKSLNPKKEEQAILIYGSRYKLWREGRYIGIATWTKDINVGDSFQTTTTTEDGRLLANIFIADKWELEIRPV